MFWASTPCVTSGDAIGTLVGPAVPREPGGGEGRRHHAGGLGQTAADLGKRRKFMKKKKPENFVLSIIGNY